MTALLIATIVLFVVLIGVVADDLCVRTRRPPRSGGSTRRIVFPFTARALSRPSLDAALRLARAEDATLVPVYLATVPLHLPLDTPLQRQCSMAVPMLEAIEHRAATYGVPVDARIERGRDRRHALRETITHEAFDQMVIAASPAESDGFHPDDVAWLLDHAPGEVVVLRPAADEPMRVPGNGLGHRNGPAIAAGAGVGAAALR
jgi:hypothetical protein